MLARWLIAFYTVTSIAPVLLIVIAVAGLAFGREAAENAIIGQLSDLMSQQTAEVIQTAVASAASKSVKKRRQHPSMQNPTLVVLTDRNDLDDQLFATFSMCKDLLRQTPQQAEEASTCGSCWGAHW
jgi:hypothetical protein